MLLTDNQSNTFLTGEFGPAGRTFDTAKNNIEVNNPQGLFDGWTMTGDIFHPKQGDYHNSHNKVNDWIIYTKKE